MLLSNHTFVILSASEGSHAQGNKILRFAQDDKCMLRMTRQSAQDDTTRTLRMTSEFSPFQSRTANPYKMPLTTRRQFTQCDIDRQLLATTIDRHSNSVAWAFA
jgi:hypothetical protein